MSKFSFYLRFIFCLYFFVNSTTTYTQELIIKDNDEWHYFDKGNLKDNWFKQAFQNNWKTGKSPLGYGDKKILTELSFGIDSENKDITKYFTKKINIPQTNNFLAFEFKLLRDDGAIIYVNGKELYRDNMPNSSIHSNTEAIRYIDNEEENIFISNVYDSKIFIKGINIISVEIHQSSADSSDCIFSLELIGHTDSEILKEVVNQKNKQNIKLDNKVLELTNELELQKLQSKNEMLANSNDILKFFLFIVIFILIAIFIIALFFINQQKQQLSKINNQLNETILEKIKSEKELVTLSTNLLHNKQYFKEIKAEIKGLNTDDKSTVKLIIHQINEILESDKDWKNLKKHFNAVNDGFYDKLIEKHPELTETELRHCMFIKLHLQTKEIANILFIDPRSVQTARYRIKKKLKLEENIDLREYLLKF